MAFRGGYFLLQLLQLLLLCCALQYGALELTDITFMQMVCFTVMTVNIICLNRNVIDFIHKFCSVTIVVAACRPICLSFCTVITFITFY